MVPDIAGKSASFAGAAAYYLHDKRQRGQSLQPTTSERVAWTEIRNLPVNDPHMAMQLMRITASQADELKRRAGIKATGRRSDNAVYAFSLSWHPDEAVGLTRDDMLRAADEALAALNVSHLQCVIVCHRDQPHPHVHCIVNRVDPEDGRMAGLSKDREILSRWAHGYERERGPLLTPRRAAKYGPEAERGRAVDAPGRQAEPSPRAMLAQLDAAQKDRHKAEWQALDDAYKAEREAIQARHPTVKAIIAEHRKARQAEEAVLKERQDKDMAALDSQNRSLIGRLRNAYEAAREAKKPEGSRMQLVKKSIGYALSPSSLRDKLAAKQKSERQALAGASKAKLAAMITETKINRQTELSELAKRHEQDQQSLIDRQAVENAKMKEAWRSAPLPERSKRERNGSKSGPDGKGKTQRDRPKRQGQPRNRQRDRGRGR